MWLEGGEDIINGEVHCAAITKIHLGDGHSVGWRDNVSSIVLVHGVWEILCITTRNGNNLDVLVKEGHSR